MMMNSLLPQQKRTPRKGEGESISLHKAAADLTCLVLSSLPKTAYPDGDHSLPTL